MKIIVLGAGQVGGTLAENLAMEKNDITVIDTRADRLRELQSRLDIRTITGSGSHPHILEQAGAEDADMLIAVTNFDEINMLACQVAYTLFHTPTKIARVRSRHYLIHHDLFNNDDIPVDFCISPEQLVTNYVQRLIEHPGALQVLDFGGGYAQLVAVKPNYGGVLLGKNITALTECLPNVDAHVAAIFRGNESIKLDENTIFEVGDEIFFIAARENISAIMSAARPTERSNKRVLIAGGGNIGQCMAETLENIFLVKVLERDPIRAQQLAGCLSSATILLGDASDKELLIEENIENTDVFCAVTNDDEVNIMSAMLAKKLGAKTVMSLIGRTAYIDLIEGGEIDVAISPRLATIGSILTHMRRGDIVRVHSLRRGAAEAIEVVAHGDRYTSKVVGRPLASLRLPKGASIGAIIRGEQVIIAKKDTIIASGDHIVLFLADKKHIGEVEQLFQVSITYIG